MPTDPRRHRAVATFLLTTGLSLTASAQANFRSTPRGGRSALMGHTGVALGRDGANAFVNPATLINVEDTRLSFTANFFQFGYLTASGWYNPGPVDEERYGPVEPASARWSWDDLTGLPSIVCLATDFGSRKGRPHGVKPQDLKRPFGYKLGACFGEMQRSKISFVAEGITRTQEDGAFVLQHQSINRNTKRFYGGPTFAVGDDRWSAGVTLALVHTKLENTVRTSHVVARGNAAASGSLDTDTRAQSFDFTAVVGGTYRTGPWTFGLSLMTPGLNVGGESKAEVDTFVSGSANAGGLDDLQEATTFEGDFTSRFPLRTTAGVGYWGGRWLVELDAIITFGGTRFTGKGTTAAVSRDVGGGVTLSETDERVEASNGTTLELSLGAEYMVEEHLGLLGGVFTGFSPVVLSDDAPTAKTFVQERTNRLGVSFGLGSYGDPGDLLVGFVTSYVFGESFAVNQFAETPRFSRVETQGFDIMLVLTGSTSLPTIQRTVSDLQKASGAQ